MQMKSNHFHTELHLNIRLEKSKKKFDNQIDFERFYPKELYLVVTLQEQVDRNKRHWNKILHRAKSKTNDEKTSIQSDEKLFTLRTW